MVQLFPNFDSITRSSKDGHFAENDFLMLSSLMLSSFIHFKINSLYIFKPRNCVCGHLEFCNALTIDLLWHESLRCHGPLFLP